jgi:hypothetical protein
MGMAEDRRDAIFEAKKLVLSVDESADQKIPPPDGQGVWRWVGAEGPLARLGVEHGVNPTRSAFNRVAAGLHAETGDEVRPTTTLKREGGYVQGVNTGVGSFRVPATEQAWPTAGPTARAAIGKALIDEAKKGMALAAGTDQFVGAARVTDLGDDVRVDWAILGADRGDGLKGPYPPGGIGKVGDFPQKATERVEAVLGTLPPEVAAADPTPRSEKGPSRSPAIPDGQLADSLTDHCSALGDEATRMIHDAAEQKARKEHLHNASYDALNRLRPSGNPFSGLPEKPDEHQIDAWWNNHFRDAVNTVSYETAAIAKACDGYAALAEREGKRRGEPLLADPIAAIRKVRGEEWARKVERHAAVEASGLASMPEEERQAKTAAARQAKEADGFAGIDFKSAVDMVAQQHHRNVCNELEVVRREQEGAGAARATGVERGSIVESAPVEAASPGLG